MKRTAAAFVAVMLLLAGGSGIAQNNKQAMKERQEMMKATKKELNEKASKDARKEAKRLNKEGWKTAPGALPSRSSSTARISCSSSMTTRAIPNSSWPRA